MTNGGLGATTAGSAGFGDVLAGVLVGASAFLVGKIAVDQILIARKERFERKGQPKEAVRAKETTLDGIVKLFGIGFSVYRMTVDLPALYDEIKKLNP